MTDCELQPGTQARWYRQVRGGYGTFGWVPVVVVERRGKRLLVDALKADGTTARRWVSCEHVKPRA